MVGDFGMADGAEQNRVAGPEQVDCAGGHHAAPAEVVVGPPVEMGESEFEIEFSAHLLKHTKGGRNHFVADTVTGDYRDFMGGHEISS